MASATQEKYNIPILTKGMELLELLSRNPQGMTLQEMVNDLKHSKTSVYRIVCSLDKMGYLRKDEITGSFFLTRKLFGMGLASLGSASIIEHSYDPMRRLRDKLKETVVLGTIMDDKIVILEQILGSRHFSFILKSGMDICLHSSAPGKVFLAFSESDDADNMIRNINFIKFNDNTITNASALREELDKVHRSGYALDMGEELAGVRCIGAPIFNQSGQITASVWITGPAERITNDSLEEYSRDVVACAEEISGRMGYGDVM